MRKPRVLLLRGHQANPWDLRPWEELTDRFDVACLVTGSNLYSVDTVRLERRRIRALRDWLPAGRLGDLAVAVPGDRYLGLDRALAGADIVHSAELGPWFSAQPAALKSRMRFKLVLTVWETIPLRQTYRTARAARHRGATIAEVDAFLPTTERAKQCLLLEDVPPERIAVCPPGIDVTAFAAGDGGEPAEPVVLSPGRLVWEKGHQDVIRAVAALQRGLIGEPTRVRLLIVGAGPEEKRLKAYAADLAIADRVEFVRSVPYAEMPSVFARASCVVLASLPIPAWEEQFGMVLAEAMAAGTPVVASTSGAIPEVVGEDARLVAPGDWVEIARALRALVVDGRPRSAPSATGRVERFSTEAAAERIAAAYARVLDG